MSEEKHDPAEDVTAHVPADSDDYVPPAAPPEAGSPPPAWPHPGATTPPPGYPPPGGTSFPPPGGTSPPPPSSPLGGAGFPPPGGFPPPPPGTAGWATRYGLVRPARGRVLAGVCSAIGRATNTDPVLWRVLFAVLTLAGGLSIFLYVVGWLLIPAEGDTGSPLEALIGRGRSGTSPVLVVIVAVAAGLSAGSFVFGQLRPVLIVAVLIAAAVVLAHRGGLGRIRGTAEAAPPPGTPPPAAGYEPPASFGAAAYEPSAYQTSVTDTVPPATDPGYRPPFAPYGPYASSPYPYPGLGSPPPPPPVKTKPSRPPSRLGRFTLSLTLLVLGLVTLIDIVDNGHVPVAAYFAAALGTVGLGLLIGAWVGRARGLIFLGLVLSALLLGTSAVGDVGAFRGSAGDVSWVPTSMTELSDSYEHSLGNADLDLTQLNFNGLDKHVSARVGAGNLHVTVPQYVDVVVHAKVNVGNSNVFDSTWDGVNNPSRTILDNDTDGPGHGHLTLDLRVNAGTLEVTR